MPKETTPAPEKTVRVYNRSQHRSFIHDAHRLAPSSFADVPATVAERWLSMFPDTVVEAGVAQKELGGLQTQLAEKSTALTAAEARIKELEALVAKNAPTDTKKNPSAQV